MMELNYMAILAATVANMIVGAVWFAPGIFGNPWMAGIGKTKEQVEADFSPMKYLYAIIGALISSVTLAIIIKWAGANTLMNGAGIGLLAGVGLLTANNGVNYVFEGRPAKLFCINNGFDLVNLVVAGAILGAWQ